jgi:hypothetical protein
VRSVGLTHAAQVDVVVDPSSFPFVMRMAFYALTTVPFKWLRALGVHDVAQLSYFRLWTDEVRQALLRALASPPETTSRTLSRAICLWRSRPSARRRAHRVGVRPCQQRVRPQGWHDLRPSRVRSDVRSEPGCVAVVVAYTLCNGRGTARALCETEYAQPCNRAMQLAA